MRYGAQQRALARADRTIAPHGAGQLRLEFEGDLAAVTAAFMNIGFLPSVRQVMETTCASFKFRQGHALASTHKTLQPSGVRHPKSIRARSSRKPCWRLAARAGDERVFTKLYAEAARAAADASDARKRAGVTLGPLDGTIVSIKDLFDVADEANTAG